MVLRPDLRVCHLIAEHQAGHRVNIETVKRWYWLRRALNKLRKRPKETPDKLAAVIKDHRIDVVLDVGGNHGQTGEFLRQIGYRGRIVSFEPLPSAHAVLSEKAKDDPNWEVAPRMAIGAEPGTGIIHESEASDVSSLLPATAEMHAAFHKTRVVQDVETEIHSLDELFDSYVKPGERVLLKIDTQGFEKAVLDGAQDSLPRIAGVKIELSLFPLYEGEALYIDLLPVLHQAGFETYMLTETNFSVDLRRQLQVDAVMFRKEAS